MEKLFNEWLALKYKIQSIASIVQNPGIQISSKQRREWIEQVANLTNEIQVLRGKTLELIK
jgi:hypothetical protein